MSEKKGSKAAAEEMLGNHWTGGFPVDPFEIARKLGIQVIWSSLNQADERGGIILHPEKTPVIFINELDKGTPIERFTIAHELGHYYLNQGVCAFSFVNRQYPESFPHPDQDMEPHEVYANSFGANLLMPVKDVRLQYGESQDINTLAAYFGVPESCMNNRIIALLGTGKPVSKPGVKQGD